MRTPVVARRMISRRAPGPCARGSRAASGTLRRPDPCPDPCARRMPRARRVRCEPVPRLPSRACRPAFRPAASRNSSSDPAATGTRSTSPRRGSRSAGSRLPVNGTSAPYTSLFTRRKSPTSSVRSMLPLGILNASTMNARTNRKSEDRDLERLRPLPQHAQDTTLRPVHATQRVSALRLGDR